MITHEEALDLWVEELRSGKYTQLNGALRGEGNLRCCLGVACDLYRQHVGGEWTSTNGAAEFAPGGRKAASDSYLPPAVGEWFGVTFAEVRLSIKAKLGKYQTLAELNDDGFTFDQIADLIEARLIKLKKVKAKR